MSTNQFGHIAIETEDRVSHGMNAFYGTIRKNYSIINFEVRFVSDCVSSHFDDTSPIFGEKMVVEGLPGDSVRFRFEPE
jgi:hypothetical protein